MTPEAQRIAIAEACGFSRARWRFGLFPNNQPIIECDNYHSKEEAEKEYRKLKKEGCAVSNIEEYKLPVKLLPNYLSDLNAMHEAEKVLNGDQCNLYVILLLPNKPNASGRGDELTQGVWNCLHATAAQRAEAFLKTLNLWKDQPNFRGRK